MDARSIVVAAASGRAAGAVVAGMEHVSRHRPGRFAVLTYHRILPRERHGEVYPGLISATPHGFAEQMRQLALRCNPISLEQLLASLDGGDALPPRAVLVTFDDACRDVATEAWPLMRQLGIPATVFVPTRFVDGTAVFWWDAVWRGIGRAAARGTIVRGPSGSLWVGTPRARVRAFRSLRPRFERAASEELPGLIEAAFGRRPDARSDVMTSVELRALHREGVALASHTRHHRVLVGLPAAIVSAEVVGGRSDLEAIIGVPPLPAFAYPGGRIDAVARRVVGERFRVAFSTSRGINAPSRFDPLAVNRINVGARATPQVIRAQLLPLGGTGPRLAPGQGDASRLSA